MVACADSPSCSRKLSCLAQSSPCCFFACFHHALRRASSVSDAPPQLSTQSACAPSACPICRGHVIRIVIIPRPAIARSPRSCELLLRAPLRHVAPTEASYLSANRPTRNLEPGFREGWAQGQRLNFKATSFPGEKSYDPPPSRKVTGIVEIREKRNVHLAQVALIDTARCCRLSGHVRFPTFGRILHVLGSKFVF